VRGPAQPPSHLTRVIKFWNSAQSRGTPRYAIPACLPVVLCLTGKESIKGIRTSIYKPSKNNGWKALPLTTAVTLLAF